MYEKLAGIYREDEAEMWKDANVEDQEFLGAVQGWNAEHDMYLMPLYRRFFPEDDRTLHTPQEVIEKAEEMIRNSREALKNYDKLKKDIKETVDEMVEYAQDNGVITTRQFNKYQFSDDSWLSLRGWDTEIYKTFGKDTAMQRIDEREKGRSRVPENPLKYLYAEYETAIKKATFDNAKRSLVHFIEGFPELFIKTDMTANKVVYKWKPNEENKERYQKLIDKSKSQLKKEDRDKGYVITSFAPQDYETEENSKEAVTMGILKDNELGRSEFLDAIQVFGEEYDVAYKKGGKGLKKYTWSFKDGNVWHNIVLNDKTLVEVLNSPTLKPKTANTRIVRFFAKGTRFLAMMMTSRNVTFLARNFERDFQEALFIEVPGVKDYRENYVKYVWKDRDVLMDIIARPTDTQRKLDAFKEYKQTGKLPDGKEFGGYPVKVKTREQKEKYIDGWLKTYEAYNEWMQYGGATGYVYQFSDIDTHLSNYVKLAQGNKLQRALTDKSEKIGNKKVKKTIQSAINGKGWDVLAKTFSLKYVETLTEVEENLVRFASYRAMRDGGLNEKEAAYQSRESTVNFSRYGKIQQDHCMIFVGIEK